MKLNYWGKFVDDNNPFAEYDLNDECSKLIVTLVNYLNIFKGEVCEWTRWTYWKKVDYINALNEYFKYNVKDFDDFTINRELVDISCGDIKLPISILKSLDDKCEHKMVVVGEPGELHYLLKENMKLSEFLNNNQGLVSFSMKTGERCMFIKNYINERDYIREIYYPDGGIETEVHELRWLIKNNDSLNKNVCSHSAFAYPDCFNKGYLVKKIYVRKKEDDTYNIDIRDVDSRPIGNEIRNGDSVYYQYMVEKGYFKNINEKNKEYVKQA